MQTPSKTRLTDRPEGRSPTSCSFSAAAQAPAKLPRLCFLALAPDAAALPIFKPFLDGLRVVGLVDGSTITIDVRSANSDASRFPALAAECVASRADVIVTSSTPATLAAMKATSTIPIVMHPLLDPVGAGLVKSLARPGGNVTGLSLMGPAVSARRLELLRQAFPRLARVVLLNYSVDPVSALQVAEIRKVASKLGIQLLIQDVKTPDDFASALNAGVKAGGEALMVTGESIFPANREQIAALVAKHCLLSIGPAQSWVDAGFLMSFGVDGAVFNRRTGAFVDRILKGAKPADLPVEQPTRFQLVVNQKTAKELAVKFPDAFMLQVDRVVE